MYTCYKSCHNFSAPHYHSNTLLYRTQTCCLQDIVKTLHSRKQKKSTNSTIVDPHIVQRGNNLNSLRHLSCAYKICRYSLWRMQLTTFLTLKLRIREDDRDSHSPFTLHRIESGDGEKKLKNEGEEDQMHVCWSRYPRMR